MGLYHFTGSITQRLTWAFDPAFDLSGRLGPAPYKAGAESGWRKMAADGKIKLDDVDRQILSDLQGDGRMTNVELAKCAGISAPPCLRRVRALEDGGIVRGYHADIDADALGYSVNVFAFVGLTSQAESDLREFEEMVSALPQVRECHMLMGETDFLLKIVAHDWDDFQRFLTSKLTPAPNVSHVKTALAIRSAKSLPGVPIDGVE
jgi:DNA-binding Lrp family transcriptional regulator